MRELLACVSNLTRDLRVTEEAVEWYSNVAELIPVAEVRTHAFAAQNMHGLSTDAQGVVAVTSMPEAPNLNPSLGEASLAVAILDIADLGNLGTIIQTTDAAGVDATAVGKTSVELYSSKVVRSVVGSHFHMPCVAEVKASELAARMQEVDLQVLTAEGMGEWEFSMLTQEVAETRILGAVPSGPDLRRRTLWFVGNEVRRLTGCDFDVDARVVVPLYGKAGPFNVFAALAVCACASAMA